MTDRELLERTAKAAGIPIEWHAECGSPMRLDRIGTVPWNPLTDDGDALRLQARLGLDVQYSPEAVEVVAHQHARMEGKECVAPWAWESLLSGVDPAAATRRAIVRAAAAMTGEGGAQ